MTREKTSIDSVLKDYFSFFYESPEGEKDSCQTDRYYNAPETLAPFHWFINMYCFTHNEVMAHFQYAPRHDRIVWRSVEASSRIQYTIANYHIWH